MTRDFFFYGTRSVGVCLNLVGGRDPERKRSNILNVFYELRIFCLFIRHVNFNSSDISEEALNKD